MCRLSIIVPYDRDEAAFETTLVSVLENRPEFCEVLVAHDGTYCDPFELDDEVRFVVSAEGDRNSLIHAAVRESMGRVVHILGGGARATEGWTEQPLELFEQTDVASVAPVLRDLSDGGTVVAAGWRDTGQGMRPVANGSTEPNRRQCASVDGGYLCGVFWRRATLGPLMDLDLKLAADHADYVWGIAAKVAGWRCRVAEESTIVGAPALVTPRGSAFATGSLTQQLRGSLQRGSLAGALTTAAVQLTTSPLSGRSWGESLGRLFAAAGLKGDHLRLAQHIRRVAKEIDPNAAQANVLRMPARPTSDVPAYRRAA